MADPTYADVLAQVVRPLLTAPDALTIEEVRTKNAVRLDFAVAADDGGRMIGKGGGTIRAIRTLLEFAAARNDDRVVVELKDA